MKFSRGVLENIYFDFIYYNGSRAIFLLPGLPSMPNDQEFLHYLSKKFHATAIYPRYPGTWESKGLFDYIVPEKMLEFMSKFRNITITDEFSGKDYDIRSEQLFAIGHSFGAITSLYALQQDVINKAVAIAPPLNINPTRMEFRKQYVDKLFGDAYRFGEPRKFFLQLDTNDLVYKTDDLLIFHSRDDGVVKIETNKHFYDKLEHNYVEINGYGHGGKEKIIRKYKNRIAKLFNN